MPSLKITKTPSSSSEDSYPEPAPLVHSTFTNSTGKDSDDSLSTSSKQNDHHDIEKQLKSQQSSLKPISSRASYRSIKSSYSEKEIYGDLEPKIIDLERKKTREEVVSRVHSRRYIDAVQVEEEPNHLPDDGEDYVDIDPELVTWESEDDPENPRNWAPSKKWMTTMIVALYTFVSPLASSIISPAVKDMGHDFNVTKPILLSLSVSLFVLAWAICPLFVAPLSELFGRKIVLNISIVLMALFNMCCAVSNNITMLLIFRFLAGCAGAPPLSIGAGTMADLFNDKDRNTALAVYAVGPTVGPIIAPIIAGFITENIGWRWVLGVLTIFNAVIAAFGLMFYQETYAPILLQRKAQKLRKETGNEHLHTIFELTKIPFKKQLYIAVTRPIRILCTNPVVFSLGLYMAFVYGFMYLMLVTFPALWNNYYGYNLGITGLMYLGLGVGFGFGLVFWAWIIQKVYLKLIEKNNGVSKPEYRLPMVPFSAVSLGIGLIWYGFSAQARTMWLMPLIGTAFFGFGVVAVFQAIQNYLIDINPRFSASSMAAAQVFRSFCGFGFPLFGAAMYDKLGYNYANLLSGILCFVLGIPAPILIYYYGERIRKWADQWMDDDN